MHNFTSEQINGILIFVALILQLLGVTFAAVADVNLNKRRRVAMLLSVGLTFLLVLANYAEYVLVEYVFSWGWRTFVAALGYSIRPAIIVLFVYMIAPEWKHWWTWILVGINVILHATAFFTPLVFYFDENTYVGGPLNSACLIISSVLLLYHIAVVVKISIKDRYFRSFVPLAFAIVVISGIVADNVKNFYIQHWVDYLTIAIVACCVFYYLWLHFNLVGRYQSALQAEQRFKTMVTQIQPHFIYNSLSAIAEIDGVPEMAQNAILNFSEYLRENLDAMTSPDLVTFKKETEHIQKYIELEKLRFGDKVNVQYDLKYTDFLLPALTVQMLVENAVKHGITKKYKGGTIKISSGKQGDNYVINVVDDGVGFETNSEIAKTHIGLNNIRKRLDYFVHGTLNIVSKIGEGTTATIIIPVGRKENAL